MCQNTILKSRKKQKLRIKQHAIQDNNKKDILNSTVSRKIGDFTRNWKVARTVAGQAGKPFTLARTRSPTFHWRRAAAAAAALLAPFLRLGAIRGSRLS